MKILTIWLWAFWFAINKILCEWNKNQIFYWYELNNTIHENIQKNREHPFFFKWIKILDNFKFINNLEKELSSFDLLILAIPNQFIGDFFIKNKKLLKKWVIIINLSKWINLSTNKTTSETIKNIIDDNSYEYSILSWWMIATDVINNKLLWADLWIKNSIIWDKIIKLFKNTNIKIKQRKNILNIELYGSFKNIISIIVWYHIEKEWNYSTVWYILSELLNELKILLKLYSAEENINFESFSLWWDIIASCFWNTRNKYLWALLAKWNNINQALIKLEKENKISEWYKTFQIVYQTTKNIPECKIINNFYKKHLI